MPARTVIDPHILSASMPENAAEISGPSVEPFNTKRE
jgi:hypothetical protein